MGLSYRGSSGFVCKKTLSAFNLNPALPTKGALLNTFDNVLSSPATYARSMDFRFHRKGFWHNSKTGILGLGQQGSLLRLAQYPLGLKAMALKVECKKIEHWKFVKSGVT